MARPFKEQLEYYHHDINMWDDDKFLDLRDEMGLLGYGILTALLDDIYLNSYYRKWTETHEKRFRLKYNVSLEDIKKAISYLTGTHKPLSFEDIDQSDYFFNRQLYLDDKVSASFRFQPEIRDWRHILATNADIEQYISLSGITECCILGTLLPFRLQRKLHHSGYRCQCRLSR